METQLRLVAVGYIDTDRPDNDKIVCDPAFEATWHEGAQNSVDALPPDYPTLFPLEYDAYHFGVTDRDLGLPSRSLEYTDPGERAAYVAGKCSTRRVLTIAEILAELEAQREAMEDEAFWSIGAW